MITSLKRINSFAPLVFNLKHTPTYFLQPARLFKTYDRSNLQPDLMAGLTLAIILLPQAIAFALVAELPPQMGLYTAIVGAAVAGLWGSSNQVYTGPSNAISLLVLSVLLTLAEPGTSEFIVAAGVIAVMAGMFQLGMGLARLGVLVNFVSHSVIVGFTAGAGVLIAVNQLRHLLGLQFSSHGVLETIREVIIHLPEISWPTAVLGIGAMSLIVLLRQLNPKLPGAFISMVVTSVAVFLFGLVGLKVAVIGQLPSGLPPLVDLPLFDLNFISRLSTGALAVGAIGLVQTIAIGRSISTQTGQRLDSNQEFVGQGLANCAVGVLSGYPAAGSFASSAVNFKAGARSRFSAIFSSIFVLAALFFLGPLAAYLPRAALAGVLIVTAYGMVDRAEMARIWQGTRGDALIMLATFLGTLFLDIEFAVLLGILLSFAYYIMKTSVPHVFPVLPDASFKHFARQQPEQSPCPQLGIIKISGDLYFGAVNHVEDAINQQLVSNSGQRFLLLRLQGVNHCDFSGIHMLEAVRRSCQERGGDLYMMKVQPPVLAFMRSTGFYNQLGADHFLSEDQAIGHLFHKVLDPAICIYECQVRAFQECQNLPKRTYPLDIPLFTDIPSEYVPTITPQALWQQLRNGGPPLQVVDVREPREFEQGHVPQSKLIPLSQLLLDTWDLPENNEIILVCRSGRRSVRAAYVLKQKGYQNVRILQGGILAWEAAGLLEALD